MQAAAIHADARRLAIRQETCLKSPRADCSNLHASKPLHNTGRHRSQSASDRALELVSQLVVVDAEAVQNCRVEVAHRNRILDHVVAVVIGLAVGDARAHAAARHPCGEAARMMVAAVVLLRQAALAVNRAPKFARPDHQRVVQQAALLEVGDQRIASAICLLAEDRQACPSRCRAYPIRACKPA